VLLSPYISFQPKERGVKMPRLPARVCGSPPPLCQHVSMSAWCRHHSVNTSACQGARVSWSVDTLRQRVTLSACW